LLLFDREDAAVPARVLPIDPVSNRTYHYWHVFVPGLKPGQLYGYRVKGESAPKRGLRFDATKVLLDPYGRGVVVPKGYDRAAAGGPGDNTATAMKSVVVDPGGYDWEGDQPLQRTLDLTCPRRAVHATSTARPAGGNRDLCGERSPGAEHQSDRHVVRINRFLDRRCRRPVFARGMAGGNSGRTGC
jgi:glycogen operon protein